VEEHDLFIREILISIDGHSRDCVQDVQRHNQLIMDIDRPQRFDIMRRLVDLALGDTIGDPDRSPGHQLLQPALPDAKASVQQSSSSSPPRRSDLRYSRSSRRLSSDRADLYLIANLAPVLLRPKKVIPAARKDPWSNEFDAELALEPGR
jgi:hypothetical protein